jgi:anti-anti-sigma factor
MINGVPVVTAPAEIDLTTAGQLHAVLLETTGAEQAAVVVDMTRTVFCDASGLHILLRAHKRALIPCSASLAGALALAQTRRGPAQLEALASSAAPEPRAPVYGKRRSG